MNESAEPRSGSLVSNSNAETPGGQKNRSSRPRRRSRGRHSGGGPPRHEAQPREAAEPRQAPEKKPSQQQQRDGGGRPNRRRGGRRRPSEPVAGEVLRRDAEADIPIQPMRKRPLGDVDDTTEPTFGCPMLTRTRLGMPFRGGQHVPRCSVGWAVHDEDEVLFCMHTPTRNECWKEHPERLEELVHTLRPLIESELNDEESAAD